MLEQSDQIGFATRKIKKWNSLSPAYGVYGALRRCARWCAKFISAPTLSFTPSFICPGEGIRREVSSMPWVYNLSIDQAMKEVEEAARLGLGGLLLFGLPAVKDEQASGAYAEDGIVQQAAEAEARGLFHFFHRLVDGEVVDPGHGADFAPDALAGHREGIIERVGAR